MWSHWPCSSLPESASLPSVRGTPAPVGAAPNPGALVGAPDAESTAWYCTGQSAAGGVSPGFLVLTNTTTKPVTADISAVSDTGATRPRRHRRPATSHGDAGYPRPVVGFVGIRDGHHVGGWGRGHADHQQPTGVVPGALSEHHLGSVVLRRGFHRRRQRALRVPAQPDVDPGRGRSQFRDADGHGPSHQLPGDCAAGGSRWRWRTWRRRSSRSRPSARS